MSERDFPTPRERAVFALLVLGDHLRSDVLSDGAIALRYGFEASHPIRLGSASAGRDPLFAAFRRLADGEAGPLKLALNEPESAEAEVSLEGGVGVVAYAKTRFTFEDAAMLASAPERRLHVLDEAFKARPLHRALEDELRRRVGAGSFGNDDFVDVMRTLATSPDAFIAAFEQASKKGALSKSELLPDDAHYWDNLVGLWQGAQTIEDYLGAELKHERAHQFRGELGPALGAISVSFATPLLIPKDLMRANTPEERLLALTWLADANEPFTLIGVLHYCAEHLEDQGLEDLGGRILDLLFDDMGQLETWCQIYSAMFVLATAALAEHETLARRPPFWRRLAAHAHACIILRSSAGLKGPQDAFVDWAMANAGTMFLASVERDFVHEPRWRPDWIASTFVVADVFGRVQAIIGALDDKAPSPWRDKLANPKQWLIDRHALATAHFPAPGEGARKPPPSMAELGEFADVYRKFIDAPTTEAFVRLTTLVHAFIPPRDIEAAVIEVTRGVLKPGSDDETQFDWMALALAGHIAMLWESKNLATVVAETTIALMRRGEEMSGSEAFARLLESNAALSDRSDADQNLAGHLEALAFALKSKRDLGNVEELIAALKRFDPALRPLLGRAEAAAALGAKRAG